MSKQPLDELIQDIGARAADYARKPAPRNLNSRRQIRYQLVNDGNEIVELLRDEGRDPTVEEEKTLRRIQSEIHRFDRPILEGEEAAGLERNAISAVNAVDASPPTASQCLNLAVNRSSEGQLRRSALPPIADFQIGMSAFAPTTSDFRSGADVWRGCSGGPRLTQLGHCSSHTVTGQLFPSGPPRIQD
jgi:hypothetical protein